MNSPPPLDFATLRGNQLGPVEFAFDDAVKSLAVQLDLAAAQARELLMGPSTA